MSRASEQGLLCETLSWIVGSRVKICQPLTSSKAQVRFRSRQVQMLVLERKIVLVLRMLCLNYNVLLQLCFVPWICR